MMGWLGKSIQRKIAASYVAIFLVTYSLSAFVIFTSISQTMKQTEADALSQIANQKLGAVSASLNALNTNLYAWSHLEVMNDIFSGDIDKRISRTLRQLHSQYGLNGHIYIFNTQNELIAASDPLAQNVTLPAVWASQSENNKFIDKHINPLSNGTQDTKDQALVVVLSHKIMANFNVKSQIGTIIATQPWLNFHDVIFDDNQPTLLVSNKDQKILHTSTDLPTTLEGMFAQKGTPLNLNLGNKSYLSGYANRQQDNIANWSVIALKAVKEADKPLWDVAFKLLLLGFALLIPVGGIIRWMSLTLTSPLHSLENTVSLVAREKDLNVRASITTQDEIGVLASAFNDMTENLYEAATEREDVLKKLETLNATLEKRVLDRTVDLKAANDEITKAFDQLKSTQSQLVHSEKMASLGQLVAGVAHELNNPIGFIYANFPHLEDYANEIFQLLDDLQNMKMPPEAKKALNEKIEAYELDFVKEDLHKIIASGKSGASRIKEIVASLRSFSRLDESEMKEVNLENGLDDTLSILNHYLKDRIVVKKSYTLNEPVTCKAGQINQVFTNIIFNAIQAMNEKGTLTLSTKKVAENVQIEISDTGKGIPNEIIQQIFDPFFTTKKVGEGTGLGLSISYGIIESHGGKLEVASIPNEGTTFTITLPKTPPAEIDKGNN